MSIKDQPRASQETIWDFDIDAVAGLTTNTSLTTISAHAIEGSRGSSPGSALSSAPSGLLTPTVGSNPGEAGYGDGSERRIYEEEEFVRAGSISQKMEMSIQQLMGKQDGDVRAVS